MIHPDIKGFEYGYSKNSFLHTSYHYHNSYEIYMLVEGENDYFINDRTYSLHKNDMVFIPPNTVHKSNYHSDKYTRYAINFTEETLSDIIIDTLSPIFNTYIYTPENPAFIKKLLAQIGAEYDRNDTFSKGLIIGYITELVAYCERNKTADYKTPATNPSVIRLVKYINANFSQDISRSEAAKMLKISEGHLSRLFKNNTGFGFNEYLRIIRIKNAKEYLLSTTKSVRQISADCGFLDSNYFSKIFKEDTGLSPLQYRNNKK